MKYKKIITMLLTGAMIGASLTGCAGGSNNASESTVEESTENTNASDSDDTADNTTTASDVAGKTETEEALNLANMSAEWTYNEASDAWVMTSVTAVTNPEIEDEQGVSVCVPGAYVKGIDTDGDGEADATSGTANGNLVIDYDASVTSSNGQVYTASTAPVIVNTGAAGYSEQQNQNASTTYASEGYINVSCGNRGKQSTLEDGTYTGDAPSCLVDQKNAVRFVKYNILLGNLPGNVDYFVSTGGSGGGAHATMLAATGDNSDYYDYEIEAGAVGVYKDSDGNYVTTVTINGEEVSLSDGMWGCVAYSAITSLAEADMAMAFEYYLDTTYSFNTEFQKETAKLLAAKYMEYINEQNLSLDESLVGLDINGDGDTDDTVELTIEYDETGYEETNGYHGTYVDLYLAKFCESLDYYLAGLNYADGWTWFDEDGNALSDEEVAAMTTEDKAVAFIEGRYAKGSSSSGGMGGPGGGMGDFSGGPGGDMGSFGGTDGDSAGGPPDMNGEAPSDMSGEAPSDMSGEAPSDMTGEAVDTGETVTSGMGDEVGTPDAGTTQSASSSTNSKNYSSFSEMLAAYQADIAEVEAGDEYGNNIVELYNPLNYIGAEGTSNPTWSRILMGASEGDISMLNSLNIMIAWENAGTDTEIIWQWNGGHVPSEIFGDSLALYVDKMYGQYVDGAVKVEKNSETAQTENGDATEATGTDISSWVSYDIENGASFSLADIAAYRTKGASKAVPGFDVIDYGQEDYVFGSASADARHWNKYLLEVFEENADVLAELFDN
ncbi:MAG: hypothetical protein K5669_12320 [Lachnospiraceae bacterium]|nr:hypothetical protein [Lachnospiraceae bacterium]